jgi:hypothetical protein
VSRKIGIAITIAKIKNNNEKVIMTSIARISLYQAGEF